jgi:endonuclease IV
MEDIEQKNTNKFKKKIGNTTYTVNVHFSDSTNDTAKDKIKRVIVNECGGKL